MTNNCSMLLSTNIGSPRLRQANNFLLFGTCMLQEHPQIVKEYAEDHVCLHVCLETHHMNMAETKLACIIKIHQPKEVLVLTVDGSPHCLQLHVLAEDMRRYFNQNTRIRHVVVEKGKAHEISAKAVKISRHLHQIQRLIE